MSRTGDRRSPVLAFHAVADILASVLRAAGALPAYGSRHRILAASSALQRFCPHLPLARRVRPFRLRLLAPSLMPHSVAYRVLCTLNTVIGNGSRHCVDASYFDSECRCVSSPKSTPLLLRKNLLLGSRSTPLSALATCSKDLACDARPLARRAAAAGKSFDGVARASVS